MIHWSLFALVKTCLGTTTNQPQPIRNQRDCRKRSSQGQRRYLCTFGSVRSFRRVVARSDGMLLLFATQRKPTGRHSPYERRFGAPFDGPIVPFCSSCFQKTNLNERQKVVFINMEQRCFQEVGPETCSSRTGTALRTTSRQKFHVKRFRSKEVGIKKSHEAFVFLCVDASLRHEDHAQCQHRTPPESREMELQTFLKLIATLWKQKMISGVCLGNLFTTVSCPCLNKLCTDRVDHFQSRQSTLTSIGNEPIWTICKRAVADP